MKLLVFGDLHWSTYSSIVRSREYDYSTRLNNLMKTLQWIEDMSLAHRVDAIIGLGDFFDRADLNAEEISALNEISWSYCDHYYLVGNHEAGRSDLEYSSSHLLSLCEHSFIINKPEHLVLDDHVLHFLPYISEEGDKSLSKYVQKVEGKKNVVFSHNDIKGVQMGKFLSQNGFEIEDIEANCDLYVNGHLHNGQWITNKILNLGNITGQNFGEDASKYPHRVMIIDTSDSSIDFIDNPYAFNFYKLDFCNYSQDKILCELNNLKENAVITVKVSSSDVDYVKTLLNENLKNKIVASRILIDNVEVESTEELNTEDLTLDYVGRFYDYVIENVGKDDLTMKELSIIVGGEN